MNLVEKINSNKYIVIDTSTALIIRDRKSVDSFLLWAEEHNLKAASGEPASYLKTNLYYNISSSIRHVVVVIDVYEGTEYRLAYADIDYLEDTFNGGRSNICLDEDIGKYNDSYYEYDYTKILVYMLT